MTVKIQRFFHFNEQLEHRVGFDELIMSQKALYLPSMNNLIKDLSEWGFRYSGDTNNDSKAYTDVSKKMIFIGKDKTDNEAVLSLMYEMTNATNSLKIEKIHSQYLSDVEPNRERAIGYAKDILNVEANAVFNRSIIAISLGLESLVKNKKYVEIVKANAEDSAKAISEIYLEMVENGTVHNGKKKALDHYSAQYFEYNKNKKSPLKINL